MDREQLLGIYFTMNKIRKFEEKALHLFESNKLRGSVHLCIGQEATPATVCSMLRDEDYITSTHRGHGHCIAKGADVRYALAELMGKATGYCKGRGGSMHIADFTKGNLGANAIVGGGIPIAVGAGLASKMQKNDRVAVSFFGDSATNEGTFHESLNLAAVWKLPVIFVCENNLYGISVPQWQSTSVKDISVRGEAYNIPHFTVDGNKPTRSLPSLRRRSQGQRRARVPRSSSARHTDGSDTGPETPSPTAPRKRSRNGRRSARSSTQGTFFLRWEFPRRSLTDLKTRLRRLWTRRSSSR